MLHEISATGDAHEHDDDESAARWREAILRLSSELEDAAQERDDLSAILLDALDHAMERVVIHGDRKDLLALEQWLATGS